jgi:hypothetical protein
LATTWRIALNVVGSQGTDEVMTFHVKDDPDVVGSGLSAGGVCDVVDTWLTSYMLPLIPTDGRFDRIVATEDVEYWLPGTLGRSGEKAINTPGTFGPADGKLPREACLWAKIQTDTAKRFARGGIHSPSPQDSRMTTTTGELNPSNGYVTAFDAFCDHLLAGHDYGESGTGGHLSLIVYSVTQRKRNAANYYFDATAVVPAQRLRWLRTRVTNP